MSFLVWKGTVLPGSAGMWVSLTEKHSCLVSPRSSVIWICPHRLLQTPTRAAPAHCPLHPPRLTVGLYAPSTLLWRQKAAIKMLLSARVCNSQEIRTGNAPAALELGADSRSDIHVFTRTSSVEQLCLQGVTWLWSGVPWSVTSNWNWKSPHQWAILTPPPRHGAACASPAGP